MISVSVSIYEPIEAVRAVAGVPSGNTKEIAMEVIIWIDLVLIIAVVAAAIRELLLIKRERTEAAAEIRRKRVAASGFRVIK